MKQGIKAWAIISEKDGVLFEAIPQEEGVNIEGYLQHEYYQYSDEKVKVVPCTIIF